ncbi:RNA polymerase sigma factor [Lunatimonas salinarum]|uniref:RNA polymerase sigma factor n=1 Tax=Lunatimonas salinarum TaxID=1774590 RepID=UPI001ADF9404|nr:sigma-70 family RNA polymerase sigma factor [Lunatimonas salinarum]
MPSPKSYANSDSSFEDSVLWQRVKVGDRTALQALYVNYVQELFRLGMSIKADRSLVKDCIQDVFLKIWQYRDTVKPTDNVKLYLFKCLSNRIHKEVGREKRRYGSLSSDLEESLICGQDVDSENASIRKEKGRDLMKALNALPSRQHEVIQLLYFENHSYEDISAIMGINVQSVYTLAWKALTNLKRQILFILLSLLTT